MREPQLRDAPDRIVFLGHVSPENLITLVRKQCIMLSYPNQKGGEDTMATAIEEAKEETTENFGKLHVKQYISLLYATAYFSDCL